MMSIGHLVNRFKPPPLCLRSSKCLIQRFASRESEGSSRKTFGYKSQESRRNNQNVVLYSTAGVLVALAASYAAVPLYRLYCQSTGKGGKAVVDQKSEQISKMIPNKNRLITVMFQADTESQMVWDFKPTIKEIKLRPGETALTFYTAKNPLPTPVDGVATYSVMPYEAGLYLNKIQCFCFEEQRLNPNEEVDMPVFFYIDPEYAEDPRLENVDIITLSYVFFESKEGVELPNLRIPQPLKS